MFWDLPSVVLYNPSWHDHNHHIVCGDLMEASMFSVYKVRVRHPDTIHNCVAKEHGRVESVIKPFVFPLLTEENVQRKILVTNKNNLNTLSTIYYHFQYVAYQIVTENWPCVYFELISCKMT